MNVNSFRVLSISIPALVLLSLAVIPLRGDSETRNGFSLANSLIPIEAILPGGPPKDGIPAIDRPKFISAANATYLDPQDRIVGVDLNGQVKAYPIAILNWHEIVNDKIGGKPIVVSFCPLCGTAMVFNADAKGIRTFGVSGLLYNSDVLMYDRESQSLWSQIQQQAVTGPMAGTRLELVAASHTSWQAWSARHPDTWVLSRETGYQRDYERNPYADYQLQRTLYFPVAHNSNRYHPKEQVLGIHLNGITRAYPFVELAKQAKPQFVDTINGQRVLVEWRDRARTASVYALVEGNQRGVALPVTIAYWFAWFAFYPQTEVFQAP